MSRAHKKKRKCEDAFLFYWPRGMNFLEETDLAREVVQWCEENLEDDYTDANDGIFIYEETDAIAFKLVWGSVGYTQKR